MALYFFPPFHGCEEAALHDAFACRRLALHVRLNRRASHRTAPRFLMSTALRLLLGLRSTAVGLHASFDAGQQMPCVPGSATLCTVQAAAVDCAHAAPGSVLLQQADLWTYRILQLLWLEEAIRPTQIL